MFQVPGALLFFCHFGPFFMFSVRCFYYVNDCKLLHLLQIFLCFSNGNHYDCIYPQSFKDDAAIVQCKEK